MINKYAIPCIENKCNCFIIGFDNSQEAMEFINDGGKYNLAVIDRMALCGDNGDKVINLSKRKNPNIPVIATSVWDSKPTNANVNYNKTRGVEDLLNLIKGFL